MTTKPIIRVAAVDVELGDRQSKDLAAGEYVVICAEPMYVAHEQRHRNGTVVLTLRRREQP